jgi:hypothetical protein
MDDEQVSVREYLESLVDGLAASFNQYEIAHRREHELGDEARGHAASNLKYRLEILNEWRNKGTDDRATFLTIATHKLEMDRISTRMDALNNILRGVLVSVIVLLLGTVANLIVLLAR